MPLWAHSQKLIAGGRQHHCPTIAENQSRTETKLSAIPLPAPSLSRAGCEFGRPCGASEQIETTLMRRCRTDPYSAGPRSACRPSAVKLDNNFEGNDGPGADLALDRGTVAMSHQQTSLLCTPTLPTHLSLPFALITAEGTEVKRCVVEGRLARAPYRVGQASLWHL
jgi:hypothetical protein